MMRTPSNDKRTQAEQAARTAYWLSQGLCGECGAKKGKCPHTNNETPKAIRIVLIPFRYLLFAILWILVLPLRFLALFTDVQMQDIEKITDQRKLAKIARQSGNPFIRMAAAEKLTEQRIAQEVYAEIVKNGQPYIVFEALHKITDRDILADIEMNVDSIFGNRAVILEIIKEKTENIPLDER